MKQFRTLAKAAVADRLSVPKDADYMRPHPLRRTLLRSGVYGEELLNHFGWMDGAGVELPHSNMTPEIEEALLEVIEVNPELHEDWITNAAHVLGYAAGVRGEDVVDRDRMSPVELGGGMVTVPEVERLCKSYGVDFLDFYRGGKECGEWDEKQAKRKRWEAFEAGQHHRAMARKLEENEVIALVERQQAEGGEG